jgi:hypothetical protein
MAVIISQTGTSENQERKEPVESQYLPAGYPVGRKTLSEATPPFQPEPAMRETVNAQIESLKQHIDDSIKLLKAELGGQIDILRRDINDLQSEKQQKQHKRWDIKLMLLSGLIVLLITGVGAVIGWFLNLHFK